MAASASQTGADGANSKVIIAKTKERELKQITRDE
jgi:hypothetical protein